MTADPGSGDTPPQPAPRGTDAGDVARDGRPGAEGGSPFEPREPQPGPDLPPGEEVLAVDATVVEERGRYVVVMDVLLVSGAVRRRAGDYPDRARAAQAARIIVRNARRHLPPAPPEP